MKKLLLCFIVVFFALSSIAASDLKFYSDRQCGYSGYAMAEYIGTLDYIGPHACAGIQESNMYKSGCIKVGHCSKVSKQENFLLWEALDEYHYRANEVYTVLILQDNQLLSLTAVINKDRKSCALYGGSYWRY